MTVEQTQDQASPGGGSPYGTGSSRALSQSTSGIPRLIHRSLSSDLSSSTATPTSSIPAKPFATISTPSSPRPSRPSSISLFSPMPSASGDSAVTSSISGISPRPRSITLSTSRVESPRRAPRPLPPSIGLLPSQSTSALPLPKVRAPSNPCVGQCVEKIRVLEGEKEALSLQAFQIEMVAVENLQLRARLQDMEREMEDLRLQLKIAGPHAISRGTSAALTAPTTPTTPTTHSPVASLAALPPHLPKIVFRRPHLQRPRGEEAWSDGTTEDEGPATPAFRPRHPPLMEEEANDRSYISYYDDEGDEDEDEDDDDDPDFAPQMNHVESKMDDLWAQIAALESDLKPKTKPSLSSLTFLPSEEEITEDLKGPRSSSPLSSLHPPTNPFEAWGIQEEEEEEGAIPKENHGEETEETDSAPTPLAIRRSDSRASTASASSLDQEIEAQLAVQDTDQMELFFRSKSLFASSNVMDSIDGAPWAAIPDDEFDRMLPANASILGLSSPPLASSPPSASSFSPPPEVARRRRAPTFPEADRAAEEDRVIREIGQEMEELEIHGEGLLFDAERFEEEARSLRRALRRAEQDAQVLSVEETELEGRLAVLHVKLAAATKACARWKGRGNIGEGYERRREALEEAARAEELLCDRVRERARDARVDIDNIRLQWEETRGRAEAAKEAAALLDDTLRSLQNNYEHRVRAQHRKQSALDERHRRRKEWVPAREAMRELDALL